MTEREEMSDSEFVWYWVKRIGSVVILLAAAGMWGCPQYNVYSARMEGEAAIALQTRQGQAALASAQSSRLVLVAQAEAEREAASKRAEAIKIVGQAAKEFPEYRQQEFIGAFGEALHSGKIAQIIYVPTEANIPIIERKAAAK